MTDTIAPFNKCLTRYDPDLPLKYTEEMGRKLMALHMIHAEHKGELDRPVKSVGGSWLAWVLLICAVLFGFWFGKI